MTVGDICKRNTIIVKPETPILEAVGLMKWYHVGDLVVVEDRNGQHVPVGILTDRDVALSLVTHTGRLPYLRVSDLMSRNLITALAHENVSDAMKKMEAHGVRRLPVIAPDGRLQGIVTFDDIIEMLSDELTEMAKLVIREQKRERQRLES